jgi:acetyl esterase
MDPDVKVLLERAARTRLPPLETLPVEEARAAFEQRIARLESTPESMALVKALTISGPRGEIEARWYVPETLTRPPLLYLHGGGFVLGSLDAYDPLLRRLANRLRCAVLSPAYGLAPENPFPAALEDAMAVALALDEAAQPLGLPVPGWVIGGDSAGANLAAGVALELPCSKRPRAQMLLYPVVDPGWRGDSHVRFGRGHLLDLAFMDWAMSLYLGNAVQVSDPRVAPAQRCNLERAPTTLLVTAGLDPLCDEGLHFATALERAGVGVKRLHYPELVHGFICMTGVLRAAGTATDEICSTFDVLRRQGGAT